MLASDNWRILLYPLGFLSFIFFGARFLFQWIQSEKAERSLVSPLFWKLSLTGNILLFIHSFIQMQFHVCVIQAWNAVISWRNLDLMQDKRKPAKFSTVIALLLGAFLCTCLGFAAQNWWLDPNQSWFRIPLAPWQSGSILSSSFFWNLLGSVAYFLFSFRFWIQWWMAEKAQVSTLPLSFWSLSLGGGILSIIYFYHIGDSVNIIGLITGIIPYARNIQLILRSKKLETKT